MTYDIFSSTAPAMPATGNGTKFIDFILSNASKDMKEALVPRLETSLSPTFARVELRGNAEKIELDLCANKRKRARSQPSPRA